MGVDLVSGRYPHHRTFEGGVRGLRRRGASDVASSWLHRQPPEVVVDSSGLLSLPRPSLEYRGRSGLDRRGQASQSPISSVIGDGIAPLMPRPPSAPRSSSVCDSRHSSRATYDGSRIYLLISAVLHCGLSFWRTVTWKCRRTPRTWAGGSTSRGPFSRASGQRLSMPQSISMRRNSWPFTSSFGTSFPHPPLRAISLGGRTVPRLWRTSERKVAQYLALSFF